MIKSLFAAALAMALTGVAQAGTIELATSAAAGAAPRDVALFASRMSELPEPEVFAMMLVGLVLIGYRWRRDNNDKFK